MAATGQRPYAQGGQIRTAVHELHILVPSGDADFVRKAVHSANGTVLGEWDHSKAGSMSPPDGGSTVVLQELMGPVTEMRLRGWKCPNCGLFMKSIEGDGSPPLCPQCNPGAEKSQACSSHNTSYVDSGAAS